MTESPSWMATYRAKTGGYLSGENDRLPMTNIPGYLSSER
jgi:hypothetical protein